MNVERHVFKSKEEWAAARKGSIGGSEVSCIVGLNPWKTNIELYEEKIGIREPEDISKKEAVVYGTKAEAPIRTLFKLDHPELKVIYYKNNFWTNSKYPFGHASLDGELIEKETGRKGILEIKTTNILQSMQREKWKDSIPNSYYCQCLFYLAITDFQFVILRAALKSVFDGVPYTQFKEYRIEREDVQEDIDYLMKKAEEFAKHVEERKIPGLVLPSI